VLAGITERYPRTFAPALDPPRAAVRPSPASYLPVPWVNWVQVAAAAESGSPRPAACKLPSGTCIARTRIWALATHIDVPVPAACRANYCKAVQLTQSCGRADLITHIDVPSARTPP
jgi:hypothetical protein